MRRKANRVQNISLQKRMAKHGWVFISPFLVGLALIYIEIIANSVIFSFSTLETGVEGYTLHFAGWENYHYSLFENAGFVRAVIGSVGAMLAQIPIIIIFSLFIATLLNQKMKLKGFFRAVFFHSGGADNRGGCDLGGRQCPA